MTALPEHLAEISLNVSAESIARYADLTGDHNPIHVDEAFARDQGGVIAHGTLCSNLLWNAIERSFTSDHFSAIELDVRYLRPVRPNMKITAGGQRSNDDPHRYDVWVRDDSNEPLISGQARLITDAPKGPDPTNKNVLPLPSFHERQQGS